jgi:hypothetical protein
MPETLRRAVSRFWELLDSETVRLFVWPFYLALLAFGVYAVLWLNPINALSGSMGVFHYKLWVFAQIVGTGTVLSGLVMRHGGKSLTQMTTPLLFFDWMGLVFQMFGHLCMFWVLLDFEIYAARTIVWGQDVLRIYAIFALCPYVLGCVFLALQVWRKIWHGEQLHRLTRTP